MRERLKRRAWKARNPQGFQGSNPCLSAITYDRKNNYRCDSARSFSTAAICLNNILKFTPGPFDLLVVLGGADLVGPMVLDKQNRVHTAGNHFFITRVDGVDYVAMRMSVFFAGNGTCVPSTRVTNFSKKSGAMT